MPLHSFILADADDFIRFIFAALFIAIWIIGALLSASRKKKKPPGQRERSWEEILRDMAGEPREERPTRPEPPPVRAEPPQRPRPQPISRAPQRPQPAERPAPLPGQRRKQRPVKTARPPLAAPPVPPAAEIPTESLAHFDQIAATEIRSGTSPETAKPPAATAASVSRWLTPGTLRSQFILTEIFQPPLALRKQHQPHGS